jgi:flagellar biosynthesis protein FlhB
MYTCISRKTLKLIILITFLLLLFLSLNNIAFADTPGPNPKSVNNPFGPISPPAGTQFGTTGNEALVNFLNKIFQVLIVIAGVYAVLNLILAGYQFISAGGNPENVEKAWSRIWQTLVGLLIVAGAFVIAGIVSFLLFGDAGKILNPQFAP